MPRTVVPTPVAAVVGLVPTVLSGVRRLPARALRLPTLALNTTFTLIGAARQEYDHLALRGEQVCARLRGQRLGQAFDALEDRVEDLIDQTPFAKAYATVEDVVEDVRDRVTGVEADEPGSSPRGGDGRTAAGVLTDELPKGAPTPKAPQNKGGQAADGEDSGRRPAGRVETAASPEVVELVQEIVAELAAGSVAPQGPHDQSPSPVLEHGDLPLPGYDHLTLGSLRGRLRALDVVQLVQLRDYEKSHANRLPVVTMLDNRIAKLATLGAAPASAPSDSSHNGSALST